MTGLPIDTLLSTLRKLQMVYACSLMGANRVAEPMAGFNYARDKTGEFAVIGRQSSAG
jgi:hypothetical protein